MCSRWHSCLQSEIDVGGTIVLSRMLTYSMMCRLKTRGCKFQWNQGAGRRPEQWKKNTEISYTETPEVRIMVHGLVFQDLSDLSSSTKLNNGRRAKPRAVNAHVQGVVHNIRPIRILARESYFIRGGGKKSNAAAAPQCVSYSAHQPTWR